MAPKRNAREATPSASASSTSTSPGAPAPPTAFAAAPGKAPRASLTDRSTYWDIFAAVWHHYVDNTPQRTFLLDAFMAFLVVLGFVQFLYCVLAGNYPMNAFLSGFSATVGQFVLTASLRMQTTEGNKAEFPSISPERAFADYVVCSLILHFFCVNFIN